MRDLRRVSLIAVLLIVLLRLSIGWQFVYEGLWKWNSLSTPTPWTAYGYLNNAKGPLRDHFRNMTGDPDELNWLDYEQMAGKWDRWRERFATHYQLDESQRAALDQLVQGVDQRSTKIDTLPAGVSFEQTAFRYHEASRVLSFDAWVPPTLKEFERIREAIPSDPEQQSESQKSFLAQLKRLQDLSSRLSFKQRLAAQLKGDPEVTGVVFVEQPEEGQERVQMRAPEKPEDHIVKLGDKRVYLDMLDDYHRKLQSADQDFEYDHLETLWGKIQKKKKNELVGPVKALEKEMKEAARKLLDYEQIARGPVPVEATQMQQIDQLTIWSLLIIGGGLMCGFATRLMAVAGAGMLMSFYAVWPPLPGLPEAPGPDHSLYINKNSIEAVALLAIAFLPTGTWFGIDGALGWLFRGKRQTER